MMETQDILSRASRLCSTFLRSSDRWVLTFDKELGFYKRPQVLAVLSALLLREHFGISTVFPKTFTEVVFSWCWRFEVDVHLINRVNE